MHKFYKTHKFCIVRLEEILKKVVANLLIRQNYANDEWYHFHTTFKVRYLVPKKHCCLKKYLVSLDKLDNVTVERKKFCHL